MAGCFDQIENSKHSTQRVPRMIQPCICTALEFQSLNREVSNTSECHTHTHRCQQKQTKDAEILSVIFVSQVSFVSRNNNLISVFQSAQFRSFPDVLETMENSHSPLSTVIRLSFRVINSQVHRDRSTANNTAQLFSSSGFHQSRKQPRKY